MFTLYSSLQKPLENLRAVKAENFHDVLSYENCERHVLNLKYCKLYSSNSAVLKDVNTDCTIGSDTQ